MFRNWPRILGLYSFNKNSGVYYNMIKTLTSILETKSSIKLEISNQTFSSDHIQGGILRFLCIL